MEIMPNSTRWLAEDVVKLIDLVRQDEAIYNARHMNYFCRPYVENFWREIDLKLGKNPGSSLAKWTNLRISFRREYQIYLNEKVPPSWIFFEKMFFLSPFLRKKRQQIEGIEPHIQEALEQISSITRGNYKSFVESIERCSGSTESVTGDERRTPDPEEEIVWDDNSIKEESLEESTNEHDDERFNDNDNVEILSDRSSLSVKLVNNCEEQQQQQQQQQQQSHNQQQLQQQSIQQQLQQQRHNFFKRLHSTHSEQNYDDHFDLSTNKKRSLPDECNNGSSNKRTASSSMLTVRNLQANMNESKTLPSENISCTIGCDNGTGCTTNNMNKHFDTFESSSSLHQQPPYQQQGRCSRSSTNTSHHGIDYSNSGRIKDELRNNCTGASADAEQKLSQVTDNNGNCNCKKDPDAMFLMSLLPDIQSLSRKDRGKLKIEIQKVVQNFLYPE